MLYQGFFKSNEQKYAFYNRASEVLDGVKDAKIKGEMLKVFDQLRAINRKWDKLLEASKANHLDVATTGKPTG